MKKLAAKSPIKSIQRGVVSPVHNTVLNVTVQSVDVSKSFLSLSNTNGISYMDSGTHALAYSRVTGGKLTSATNIEFKGVGQYYNLQNSPTVYWELIEYV